MICSHLSFTIQHNEFNTQTFLPPVIHICVCVTENPTFITDTCLQKQSAKFVMTMIYHLQCQQGTRRSSKFTAMIAEKILTWTNISVSVPISVFWILCNSVRVITGFMSDFLKKTK